MSEIKKTIGGPIDRLRKSEKRPLKLEVWDPNTEFEKETLPNGLDIYYAPWKKARWQKFIFVVHAGAREDFEGRDGTAHLVEEVITQGVKGMPSQIALEDYFFARGGKGKIGLGSTSYLDTDYGFTLPMKANLKDALNVFARMFFDPTFSQAVVEKEKQKAIVEFKQKFPYPPLSFEPRQRMMKALFSGHKRLSHFIRPLGFPESIRAITLEDIRRFHAKFYSPRNISVVTTGGLSVRELHDVVAKSGFAIQKEGNRVPTDRPLNFWAPPQQNRSEVSASTHLKTQVDHGVYLTSLVLPGTISEETLLVVRGVIGRTFFDEFESKRGWAYDIKIQPQFFQSLNQLTIAFQLKEEGLKEVEGLVNTLLEEAFQDQGLIRKVHREEIMRVATFDVSGQGLCSNAAADVVSDQRIITRNEFIEKLRALRCEDVEQLSEYFSPERRYTFLQIP